MKEIKTKLLKYFYKNGDSCYLTPIDNKYRRYYTGVSINYLAYDLLKAKYPRRIVAKALLELHSDKRIKVLYCPDVQRYVFMNNNIDYYNLHPNGYSRESYDIYVNYMTDMINGKKVNHKPLEENE